MVVHNMLGAYQREAEEIRKTLDRIQWMVDMNDNASFFMFVKCVCRDVPGIAWK